ITASCSLIILLTMQMPPRYTLFPYTTLFRSGMDETFRVNGRACISRDEALLSKTAVNGKLPKMGIGVEIEECYMHCGKAFKRSGLWDAEQWLPKNELPSASKIIAAHVSKKMQVTADQIEKSLEDTYKNRLY